VDSEAEQRAIPTPSVADISTLRGRQLAMPLQGVKPAELRDSFAEERDSVRRHEAIDIFAPRGTPVYAVDDGRVVKLFNSKQGGLTVYQFDPTETYCYYYAHLERYAAGVSEGAAIRKGNLIGYVGSTGNAPAATPHLHFSIFKLGPEKQWWRGAAMNPFPVLGGSKSLQDEKTRR
jgi:murein DD-endopeptidase MepM/ murein hydrolase activator NlpD